ncbi:helix-turn-helix domain-containing GNAT family N-acetyltransferase [Sphaerisporangium sp. B11E5]|uniref:bifunctional helix-turn-helix transcriptional regulator/GNAT family N-acetyltransferase n=1 Tax=Sphaerisporangium sp. B11E5 TaxID=3153563 RepID=UPI00325F13D5
MQELIGGVRAFNRFYTRIIGVLGAGMHDTPYSLTEARVLFELYGHGDMEAAELRRRLGLDAGYLSRMLAGFESGGLVTRERSASDARRQMVRLTGEGRAASKVLDESAAAATRDLLDPLTAEDRERLLSAMTTIRRVLAPAPRDVPYVIRPPRAGDLGWMVHRHGVLYAEEHGWDHTMEGFVAGIVADYAGSHDPRREACWIAEVDGAPAGSVMCVRGPDDRTAQLRLLLVEPSARGMGIGSRLVEECVVFARSAGYTRIVLMTVAALTSARRVYERAGFELDEQHEKAAYGTRVTEQWWSRAL